MLNTNSECVRRLADRIKDHTLPYSQRADRKSKMDIHTERDAYGVSILWEAFEDHPGAALTEPGRRRYRQFEWYIVTKRYGTVTIGTTRVEPRYLVYRPWTVFGLFRVFLILIIIQEEKSMKIQLKDGSVKEYAESKSVIDIAFDISEGLARAACAGEVDGQIVDLRTVLDKDCTLNILTARDPEGLRVVRHTCSHVLAEAVKRLFPDAKLAIGPAIDTGFYYDFEAEPFSREDLDKLEKEMKRIIKKEADWNGLPSPERKLSCLCRKKRNHTKWN